MPSFHYWISGAALWVAGSFILGVVLAAIGIKSLIPKKVFVILIGLSFLVMFIGWWTTAEQEKNSEKNKN